MEHGLVNKATIAGVWREEWPEYSLVIPAEEPVSRQVKQLQLQWKMEFGGEQLSETPPGITIAGWVARKEQEETMFRLISNLAERLESFLVTLNNFSGVPPQVIYIRVQDLEPFMQISSQLKEILALLGEQDTYRILEKPFIKLGRFSKGETPQQWYKYTHQLFHAAFTAKKLVLFRHDAQESKVIGVFPFKLADSRVYGLED